METGRLIGNLHSVLNLLRRQRWLYSFILLIDSAGLSIGELRESLLLIFKVIWILLALFELSKIQILSEDTLLDRLRITVLLFLYSQKLLILLLRLNLVQNELLSRVLVLLEQRDFVTSTFA